MASSEARSPMAAEAVGPSVTTVHTLVTGGDGDHGYRQRCLATVGYLSSRMPRAGCESLRCIVSSSPFIFILISTCFFFFFIFRSKPVVKALVAKHLEVQTQDSKSCLLGQ